MVSRRLYCGIRSAELRFAVLLAMLRHLVKRSDAVNLSVARQTLCLLTSLAIPAMAQSSPAVTRDSIVPPWPTGTFSILAFDPTTGEIGGAVQSRVFSVGNGVLSAEAGVGAAATQAIVDVGYGPRAIALLRQGVLPEQVVKSIWESDPDPRPQDWTKEGRQFAVIDAKGNVFAYTGPRATPWAGHKSCTMADAHCTAQGNILAGAAVVDSMVARFERAKGHLAYRLVAALEGGQSAGGDKRGMQSAALLIVKKDGGVWLHNDTVLRLHVDDQPEPIKELRRLVEKAAAQRQIPPAPTAP
jgi:uncharacterized Ntn-hydrolase superfamily protein